MGKERLFRFKQFKVSHGESALPIGMDGVLIGAWADVATARKILDVGTGCGVIALMCAQRCPDAVITGIDIHSPSVAEARSNFSASPWSERLYAFCTDFNAEVSTPAGNSPANINAGSCRLASKYDLIISNPPFYNSGVDLSDKATARLVARHSGSFGPAQLITAGVRILSDSGSIATIFPTDQLDIILDKCHEAGLAVQRLCRVVSRPGMPPKRIMLQAGNANTQPQYKETTLCIYDVNGAYSDAYKELTRDFYLHF